MNKILLVFLCLFVFGQCQNRESTEADEQTLEQKRKLKEDNSDYDSYNEDYDKKPYHVDTLNELIPTKLIEDKYDGFIVGDNVRLRAEADAKSDMIAELPNGFLLNILGKTDKEYILLKDDYCDETYGSPWINVETIDGQTGWIFGKFVYKVENLKHDIINQYQGKDFEFDNEMYRFGYAVDFSHPAMDNEGLSLCDDLAMLFFHKSGEKQIRPITVKKPSGQTTFPLEQNKKGFWHFVAGSDAYTEHLYEARTMENKIRFKYHACVQDGNIDGVVQVDFQNNEFTAKYIEYDTHDGSAFSELSDVKNDLFKYFEARSDLSRLYISGNEYSDEDGLAIQFNGGDARMEKGKTIPKQFVDKFDLYRLDIDKEESVTKMYGLGKKDAVVRGYYRRSYQNHELLVYSVTVGTNLSGVSATDVRLLIIDSKGNIKKNVFVAGNASEEGEAIVDRSMTLTKDGIELKIKNEENYMNNIPKYLKLKLLELIKL